MIQCQNCGQVNNQASNFCRFCGTNFGMTQMANQNNYDFSPPQPYSWKTDEFQISESQARKNKPVNRVQPLINQHPTMQAPRPPQPLAYQQPQNMTYGYRCPRCASQFLPKVVRKISTAGWVVFSILLVVFFPLFWVGLLIKEDVRVCSICNTRVG